MIILLVIFQSKMDLINALNGLQAAYPEHIQHVTAQEIIWMDGTKMPVQKNVNKVSLALQLTQIPYIPGKVSNPPEGDPGRIRYEPFFKKMYGETRADVKKNLVTIYWLPTLFGNRYPLRVTKVNGIDQKLMQISAELEKLPVTYHKFIQNPGGTYAWRKIAGTNRISLHSFGVAIDINTEYSDYWQWDLQQKGRRVTEMAYLPYHNRIPWEIILIFEKYGFIWGGKWYHYDTMHFEYRPEILNS